MTSLYFIECAGLIRGRRCTWFAERDTDRMGFANTVTDILTGQVSNVRRIYRAELSEGSIADASEDVALEILNQLCGPLEGELLDFCEEYLGCQTVAEWQRENAA